MKLPNISPQKIVLNPSCSKQAHSNRLGTSHNYENMGACMYDDDNDDILFMVSNIIK